MGTIGILIYIFIAIFIVLILSVIFFPSQNFSGGGHRDTHWHLGFLMIAGFIGLFFLSSVVYTAVKGSQHD